MDGEHAAVKLLPKHKTRNRVIMGVAAAVIIIGGLIALVHYVNRHNLQKKEAQAYIQVVAAVTADNKASKYSAALSSLQTYNGQYQDIAPLVHKVWLTENLAQVYQNLKDYADSSIWQQKALALAAHPGYSDYFNTAVLCDRASDKACAIKYYQLTLTKISNKDPIADGDRTFIKLQLARLGVKQ